MSFSPHGCRVHLTGGEPFGDWQGLILLARLAHERGLGPLQKVETNAFWATEESVVRRRVSALDQAGMEKFRISSDPYHQQFVPIGRVRRAARVAREVLGQDRVQVRWDDWLDEGGDTSGLTDRRRAELFAEYAARGRDRINGRAADRLGPVVQRKKWQHFADETCKETLLRGKQVHVGPGGLILPGTCGGIVLGRTAGLDGIAEAWTALNDDHEQRPIVGTLAREGPVGLVRWASEQGFVPDPRGYAGKCHLCWQVRRFLARQRPDIPELQPTWMYGDAGQCGQIMIEDV